MEAPRDLDELFALYESRGNEPYSEALTQTEHGLQCAALARADGANDGLVAAALFHDVGHLVAQRQNQSGFELDEDDDDHEAIGARVLSPLLGPNVARPVSLHVTAKRWRCTRQPSYLVELSQASRLTLKAQGGPLSDEECRRFEEHPGFHDALWLRTWDDQGKVTGLEVGTLGDYRPLIMTLAAAWSQERHER
jgi:[1-hydroxy-2-(trimethylamino)ethyl]phosphonate dioxygenase